jgi:Cof subfamily protein (haloacid dehalogenase superfamily)
LLYNDTHINLPVFKHVPGAIAIDLDGTLLNSRLKVTVRNRAAIEKCIARGIPVIIATARTLRAVRRYIGEELSGLCSLVMQNGAIGKASPPFSGSFKVSLPDALVREIVATVLSMEPCARITLEIDGLAFGTSHPRDAETLWQVNSATPEMQLSLEKAIPLGPAKIAVGGLNRDLSHIITELSRRFGNLLSIVPSDGLTFLNITGKRATKPAALKKILGSLNKTLDNVIAFGDDFPDLEMLQACGTAVAMANAIPEIKAVCEHCTLSNDDDGVAIVLEKMLADIAHLT